MNEKVEKVTPSPENWEKFRQAGMLWFVNRILHVFNWSIICSYDEEGNFLQAWPEQTTWKGFPSDSEEAGYEKVEQFLKDEFGKL